LSADVLRSAEPFSRQPVRRIAGTDRYRTAAAVAAEFVRTPTSVTTYIAAGRNFPDALVGAAAAARDGAPVLLTPQATVHPATTGVLTEYPPRALYVLGGSSVIYSSTMTSLAEYVAAPGSAERFTPLSDSADFDWSGQQWSAKDAISQGPGPNLWHRSGVELGDRGSMRLTVQKNSAGQWQSSEVGRNGPTGYGTFAFTTTSSVLPPNEQSVLGLFSYQHLTPDEGYEEIDIEYSQWAKPGTGPGSVTVHKPSPPWHREFSLDYTGPMTHSFLWAPGYIAWQIVREDTGEVLYERELWGADVPKYVDARMRMNLWLIDGVPADQQEPFEVTFSSATWTPLPAEFVAPAAPTSPPVTADLREAFDGPLQTSRWPGRFQYGGPQVSQGRLDVPMGPGFHGIRSESEYRLAGSSIAVEQIRPRSVHPNSESELSFLQGEQNSIALITVGNETGRARIRTGGVDRSVDFIYDRIAHRWLRIRQSGTRVYFEGSPDGLAWSAVVPSQNSPTWVLEGSGQVKLGGGNYAMDDPAGSVYFDNLNRSG
ncbi:MAG: cell wall-binding repeat-containing protein, partial [Ornithinimicrobium sp.]